MVPGPKELPPTLEILQDVREISRHTGNESQACDVNTQGPGLERRLRLRVLSALAEDAG